MLYRKEHIVSYLVFVRTWAWEGWARALQFYLNSVIPAAATTTLLMGLVNAKEQSSNATTARYNRNCMQFRRGDSFKLTWRCEHKTSTIGKQRRPQMCSTWAFHLAAHLNGAAAPISSQVYCRILRPCTPLNCCCAAVCKAPCQVVIPL